MIGNFLFTRSEEDDALLNDDELLADDPQPGYVTAEVNRQLKYLIYNTPN